MTCKNNDNLLKQMLKTHLHSLKWLVSHVTNMIPGTNTFPKYKTEHYTLITKCQI